MTFDVSLLAALIRAGVVPYRSAISQSVSDRRTVWRVGASTAARSVDSERPVNAAT